MTDLSDKKCVPCEGGIPPFTKDQIQEHLTMVDSWQVHMRMSQLSIIF